MSKKNNYTLLSCESGWFGKAQDQIWRFDLSGNHSLIIKCLSNQNAGQCLTLGMDAVAYGSMALAPVFPQK
jgi:hypothetical protein